MKKTLLKSYAKINISLNVLNKHEDGYHELDSVMLPLELHDSLIMEEHSRLENYVTMDDFSLAFDNFNLITLAIDTLAARYKFSNKYRILVHKNIPMQGGLGGGSSNAAAVMNAINKDLKLNIPYEEMVEIAAKLGADIPFFLKTVPARARGIGEKLTPITVKNNYHVLIVKPSQGLSTKTVFDTYDKMNIYTTNIDDVVKALETGDDELLASSIHNSLEEPAISLLPEIQIVKDKLMSYGLKIVLMSGSGSCVFALSQNKAILNKIASELEDTYLVEVTKVKK